MLFLNATCYYSEVLLNEVWQHFPTISDTEYLLFKTQHFNFLEHRKNVVEICNLKDVKPYSYEDLAILGDVNKISFKVQNPHNVLYDSIYRPPTLNELDTKNSTSLINEIDIESFLLESVFNIKSD